MGGQNLPKMQTIVTTQVVFLARLASWRESHSSPQNVCCSKLTRELVGARGFDRCAGSATGQPQAPRRGQARDGLHQPRLRQWTEVCETLPQMNFREKLKLVGARGFDRCAGSATGQPQAARRGQARDGLRQPRPRRGRRNAKRSERITFGKTGIGRGERI